MPNDNGSSKVNIQVSSIKEIVDNQFSTDPVHGLGLVVAYRDDKIYIGFHKDYIEYDTHNAIVFGVNEEVFLGLIRITKERNTQ